MHGDHNTDLDPKPDLNTEMYLVRLSLSLSIGRCGVTSQMNIMLDIHSVCKSIVPTNKDIKIIDLL